MAINRRRSQRSSSSKKAVTPKTAQNGSAKPGPAPTLKTPTEPSPVPDDAHSDATSEDGTTCPACENKNPPKDIEQEKESWIRCDACTKWFHWRCVGHGGQPDDLDKWFCQPCMAADAKRTITLRPPARKSARNKKAHPDYANMHAGGDTGDSGRWLRMMDGKTIKGDPFRRMRGNEVTAEWLDTDETALKDPIVIETPDGLGMKMPPTDFSVNDVAELVGPDTPVEVIDVATQSNSPGWTIGKWAEYYSGDPASRDKVRNVISLEISGTPLAEKVLPPRLVRELDWVEQFWPSAKRGRGHAYPKVQLYCLMGVAQAWTDWHVDFAGSSVYYHILRGSKIFYFIRPTPANLAAYERWSGTELQNHTWLGDLVDEVVKVELKPGNTMIIPTGWIHAVYTPVDSLVFGGNFLHSYNIATQLKICEIEKSTGVPKKFRFPHFTKLCWYAAEKYLRDLKAKEEFSPRILESLDSLAHYLVTEAREIERGIEHAKKLAKENVPADRVKDPGAVARELRWRIRLAAGHASDDEGGPSRRKGKAASSNEPNGIAGLKRKRDDADDGGARAVPFKNFRPKKWDMELDETVDERSQSTRSAPRPGDGDGWATDWADWGHAWNDGDEVEVAGRRNVVVRVRRTEKGVERQKIERVVEEWVWQQPDHGHSPAEKTDMAEGMSTTLAGSDGGESESRSNGHSIAIAVDEDL